MKKILCMITIFILLAGVVSCSNDKQSELKSVYAAEKSMDVNSANTSFAFDIFNQINQTDADKNVFISPYSISTVLSMIYHGADNQTKNELADALYYDGISDEALQNGQLYLRERLMSIDRNIEIDVNNSIWIRDGFSVKSDYIDSAKYVYDAFVQSIDMSDEKAADTINKWIDNATKGMITKMIDPPIPPDVVMYLINTIYFDGKWQTPFNPERTAASDFHNSDGTTSKVDMMNMKDDFFYGEKNNEKIIEVPYGEGEVSMYLILPPEGTDINDYIKTLDSRKWENLRYGVLSDNKEEVTLMLPKFKIEYGIKNINQELKNLGISEVFTDNADLSGIADNIFLSNVLHKAVIEVDETGTKAAASTVGEITLTAMPMDPKVFEANRPFIYIISDKTDGSILFIGKMSGM
ncbi:MAG: serpin family protein [Clostridia bacterium]|nr:serpin family protein [Clostridia bacterium]